MIRLDRYDWESYYRPQTKFAKVMFLHVSVRPQGGSGPRGSLVPGRVPAPGVSGPREGTCSRGVWSQEGSGPTSGGSGPGGVLVPRGCLLQRVWSRGGVWRPPSGTLTVAGGTHPTGMHSCSEILLEGCYYDRNSMTHPHFKTV